jgi:hypothetical protein
MTNVRVNAAFSARPETADQNKQMVLKEIGAKWSKFS